MNTEEAKDWVLENIEVRQMPCGLKLLDTENEVAHILHCSFCINYVITKADEDAATTNLELRIIQHVIHASPMLESLTRMFTTSA